MDKKKQMNKQMDGFKKQMNKQMDEFKQMDIHFFKDRLLVGWTGNHRRMVGWIDKWMTGWI